MSRLEQLISELCPNGVEYKSLGELGSFYGGLTGKSKDDFNDGNEKFITYTNVFSNISLNLEVADRVKISEHEKQNELEYGDVIFTGSSEILNECGISSVLTVETDEKLYLNSFCFIFRFFNKEQYIPEFSKYIFRSTNLRKQIIRTASGVTRFNVSKEKMKKVRVPIPPIEVQKEIVDILNNLTKLTDDIIVDLAAELVARKKQYEYYRDYLLTSNEEIPRLSLKEISRKTCSGGTPLKSNKEYYENGTIPWLRTQEVVFNEITKTDCFITEKAVKETSAKWVPSNCVVVAISGASAGRCAINKIPLTTNQHCLNIELDDNLVNYKYVFYCICNQYEELIGKKEGARGDLNSTKILSLKIPVPDLEKQNKIVELLDRFNSIHNDISIEIPAEIEARKKQYEYYRDKLLTFEGIKNE